MAHNNAWANHRLHQVVAKLTDTEYRRERTSFFPSIHKTLVHILFVDIYYLAALSKGELQQDALWAEMDRFERDEGFPRLAALQRETDARLVRFLATLPEAALDERVDLPRSQGIVHERREDVLLHLFQHQIHHRGQAHAMLAGTTAKPPQLDEFFLEEDLPSRRAELAELVLPPR